MKRKSNLDTQRGESLALFLNATNGLPNHARILEIIKTCQNLESFSWKAPASVETVEGMKANLRIAKLERELNHALEGYHFRPRASLYYRFPRISRKLITEARRTNPDLLPLPIGQRFSVTWLPVGRNILTEAEAAAWKANPRLMPLGEMGAVQAVLALAAAGLLNNLRRCEQPHADSPKGVCGRWFMAIKSNKDCCSPACRVRKSHRKEGYKEKHRKYMNKWYWHPRVVKRREANAARKKRQRSGNATR